MFFWHEDYSDKDLDEIVEKFRVNAIDAEIACDGAQAAYRSACNDAFYCRLNLNRLLGVKPVRDLEIDIHWSDGIEHGKIDEIAHGKLWYFAKTRRWKWGKTSQSIEYEKAHLIQKHEAE